METIGQFKWIWILTLWMSLGQFSAHAQQAAVLENQRELFVDDYLGMELHGLDNRLHRPVERGVVLRFDKPWEGAFSGAYVSIIHDGALYRMYYRGSGHPKELAGLVTCYAESTDGIHWTKPDLGLFELGGSRDNNVVMMNNPEQSTDNFSVFYDGRPGVPAAEKYKAVGGVATYDRPLKGLYRYVSADGIHWKRFSDTTALFPGYAMDSQNVLTWVPSEGHYAIYLRAWTGDTPGDVHLKGMRSIARSVSSDFVHWSEPQMMRFGDAPMENLYTNATEPYFRAPQIMVSMPFRFSPDRKVLSDERLKELGIEHSMWKGISDGVFMTSRGGNVYERKFLSSFIRPGADPHNWAARSNIPALGIVPSGTNEMSLYVTRAYGSKECHLERVSLRLDGFASLHADYGEGYGISRPLRLKGDFLTLNFSTSSVGYVKVVLLDPSGQELPGFGEKDAIPMTGDAVDKPVKWKGGRTITALTGQMLRIKLIARDADIYAFSVRDE